LEAGPVDGQGEVPPVHKKETYNFLDAIDDEIASQFL
jgi:hypothetical protein